MDAMTSATWFFLRGMYFALVSHKSTKIAELIEPLRGQDLDPHYLGFFECFNRQLFFEAHEVLEAVWLPARGGPKDLFYKGLIQLAGAFVHVQKNRRGPALALLKLADANLAKQGLVFERFEVAQARALIHAWLSRLEKPNPDGASLRLDPAPQLSLACSHQSSA